MVGNPATHSDEPAFADVSGQHVLIVDDNATYRRLLQLLLTAWGCTWEEAPEGSTALQKMRAAAKAGGRKKCLEAGIDDYVPKPVDPTTLATRIDHWLSHAPAPEDAPAAAETPAVTFDADALFERALGDTALAAKLIETFSEEAPRLVASMEETLNEGDFPALAGHAHALKGAAGNVSAAKLQELTLAVEEAANDRKTDSLAAAIAAVKDELTAFRAASAGLAEGA